VASVLASSAGPRLPREGKKRSCIDTW